MTKTNDTSYDVSISVIPNWHNLADVFRMEFYEAIIETAQEINIAKKYLVFGA